MEYVNGNGQPIEKPIINITGSCINSIIGSVTISGRKFFIYLTENKEKLLIYSGTGTAGTIIEPKKKYFDEFWETADEFERVLLNRDGKIPFKAVFETPFFTEEGYYYTMQSYIWPTINNNKKVPSLSNVGFQNYINSLYSLAAYHDEYDSDNLWRMMTHESIKNLDWSYVTTEEGVRSENELDTKGMGAMLRIYGRHFDDIKRYADNIKATNSVTYNGQDNTPDYFLSDIVEMGGIDAQNVAPFGENTVMMNGYYREKNTSDVNSFFLRNMVLNKNYIHSLKGTRRGIETMLKMFGYSCYNEDMENPFGTYSISEYVYAISGAPLSYIEASTIRGLAEYVDTDYDPNLMQGYPVGVIGKDKEDVSTWYLVPWFDKNETYEYPFYFQGRGGWGKMPFKNINIPALTPITRLNGNVISLYKESVSYLKFATDIDEMLSFFYDDLFENIICYVADISDIEKQYNPRVGPLVSDGEDEGNDYSHYFILKNVALSTVCGYLQNHLYDCYGWKNIHISEYENEDNPTCDGERLIYMETLLTDNVGNNPHLGYGHYDDGEEYVNKYRNLFEGAINEGLFDHLAYADEDDELGKEVYSKVMSENGYGFKLDLKEDNSKCAYFYSADANSGLTLMGCSMKNDTLEWNSKKLTDFSFNPDEVEESDTLPLEESQSYGIMNVKKLFINFNVSGNTAFIDYIQNVVMKYVELMIPSTTILEYGFDNARGVNYMAAPGVYGLRSRIVTAHAAISNDDENVVWDEAKEYNII
jgi:hypothetical protein